MSDKNLSEKRAIGAKQLSFGTGNNERPLSGVSKKTLEKVCTTLTATFENNMQEEAVRPQSGASLTELNNNFNKTLVPMQNAAEVVKSPSHDSFNDLSPTLMSRLHNNER